MTRWYWQRIGGTLVEEFPAVNCSGTCGQRLIDGIIIKNEQHIIARPEEINLEGKDIIVIQTKAARLGMYLMGQAFFSASLMESFLPRSIESVALCLDDDSVLRPLFENFPNMKVVVYPKGLPLQS